MEMVKEITEYDFNKISEFLKLFPDKHPSVLPNQMSTIIRYQKNNNNDISPMKVLETFQEEYPEYNKIVNTNYELAYYVTEYYIAWSNLNKNIKEAIKFQRTYSYQSGWYQKKADYFKLLSDNCGLCLTCKFLDDCPKDFGLPNISSKKMCDEWEINPEINEEYLRGVLKRW
jgi:hypothetical protein